MHKTVSSRSSCVFCAPFFLLGSRLGRVTRQVACQSVSAGQFASRFFDLRGGSALPPPDMLHYLRTPVTPLQAGELATIPGQPHEFDGWVNLRADQTVPPLRELCLSRLCCYPNVVQKVSPTVVAALPRDVLDQVIGALLSNRLVNDQCLSLFRANHLKVLDFAMCNFLTEASLKTVGTELTHITTLILSKCEWVSDNTCSVLATLTSLKHLHLAGCEITDEGVTRLVKNAGLLSFDVSHCKQLRANALRDIGRKLENLTHLDVSWLENAQVPEKAFRKLKRLHKLQFLNLSDAKITDSTLGKLVAACTALSTLDISYCAALTDASAAKICKTGMGLKQLLFARSPLEDNDVCRQLFDSV